MNFFDLLGRERVPLDPFLGIQELEPRQGGTTNAAKCEDTWFERRVAIGVYWTLMTYGYEWQVGGIALAVYGVYSAVTVPQPFGIIGGAGFVALGASLYYAGRLTVESAEPWRQRY